MSDAETCICCHGHWPKTAHFVDERGLCLYCQPCPTCGKFGTGCGEMPWECWNQPKQPYESFAAKQARIIIETGA